MSDEKAITPLHQKNIDAQRERLIEIFEEVEMLLNYLQRLPETRVPRLFEPAFNELSRREGSPVPPSNNIQYFMNRITAISITLGNSTGFFVSHSICEPYDLKPNDPGPRLEDYAFLLWARDFLAAVTYPASVATIKVTQAYREYRSSSLCQRLASWPDCLDSRTQSTINNHANVYRQYGRMLARQTRRYNVVAFFLIFLVIWGSVLIFSGRVLIRENDRLRTAENAPVHAENPSEAMGAKTTQGKVILPDYTARKKELSDTQAAWSIYACPLVAIMKAPSAVVHKVVHDLLGRDVSDQGEQVKPVQTGKTIEPCEAAPDDSMASLRSHRYKLEMMVDGLLGSILPAAYAGLGALAALFRRIGRKVEDETLGPSDIGGMRSSLILGLLTGTVVGLISDVVSWGGKSSPPLSTTALAMLAGFASDRVFVMLDGVTDRIFGHADADPPTRAARKYPSLSRR